MHTIPNVSFLALEAYFAYDSKQHHSVDTVLNHCTQVSAPGHHLSHLLPTTGLSRNATSPVFQPIQHVRVQDLHIQSPLEHAAEELLDNWSDARIASVAPAAADQMQFHIIPATAQKYPDMTSAFYLAILMEYLANVISRSFLETP
jgi:hypothetical protein